jgi:GH15 family glucan-1,4-alpha-glucosidase
MTHSHTAADLVTSSLRVIRDGQHPGGGYVACPTYPTYRFAWLRDGAFCAYAMELHGQQDSAAAFHRFVAATMLGNAELVRAATLAAGNGRRPERMPPARYTLTGKLESAGGETWPNFQLDGYGTWLWTLREHTRRGGALTDAARDAAQLVSHYLRAAGALPCYDCWEEHGHLRHTSTLGAVIAGLSAAADFLDDAEAAAATVSLRERLATRHVRNGSYVKHEESDLVDGSLLWLALPFGIAAVDDPVMARTAARVADELTGPTGGVRRYLGDTFYGGGEWLLLTAWLGWYHAEAGDRATAERLRGWIESHATAEGHLPEQVTDAPQAAAQVAPWAAKWGPVATPLLWSHAMYLVLAHALRDG